LEVGIFMAKYSYEFKKQIVLEYLKGDGSYLCLSNKHGISNQAQLQKWVAAYKKFGDDGLKRSRNQKIYSFEEKFSIVESYLTSELSSLLMRQAVLYQRREFCGKMMRFLKKKV